MENILCARDNQLNNNTMKILFVASIDPWSKNPSGIRGYFYGLLKQYVNESMDVTLLGYSEHSENKTLYLSKFNFINVFDKIMFFSSSQILFFIALFLKSMTLSFKHFFSDYDLIHVQRIDLALPFILFTNKPIICTLHGKGSEQALDKNGKIVHELYKIIEKIVSYRLSHAIAVSDDIKNFYILNYPWISDRISVVYNGVDTIIFKPHNKKILRRKYGLTKYKKIILYMGRFHAEKNLEFLISSFDHMIKGKIKFSVNLILVGQGETKESMIKTINEKRLNSIVTIMNPVEDWMVPELINCADVFVLSSIVEGFPLMVLQALACGVPVVSTNVGDVSRVVVNNKTGFIVNQLSIDKFSDQLKYCLENSDSYSEECQKMAYKYSWKNVSNFNLHIYSHLIESFRNT